MSEPVATSSATVSLVCRASGRSSPTVAIGACGFRPIAPLYKIEHAFAQLGRWRRLSRCYEGSEASATAWLEVASVGYLLGRA